MVLSGVHHRGKDGITNSAKAIPIRVDKRSETAPPDFYTYGPDRVKKTKGSCESRTREYDHNEARKESCGHQMKGCPQGSPFFAYFL